MPMSPRLLRPRASGLVLPSDADARAYVLAVNSADQQPLDPLVVQAIDAFVQGCKADGIWSAIKASCILMGARTLSGALTPLVGTAPTNNGPFVSGDYDRKLGLLGNGSTKYLDTNRAGNSSGQNDVHGAVYGSTLDSGFGGLIPYWLGLVTGSTKVVQLHYYSGGYYFNFNRNAGGNDTWVTALATSGFVGGSRSASNVVTGRAKSENRSITTASSSPGSSNFFVFANNNGGSPGGYSVARLAFYSLGDNLQISSLDSRVTTLYTAIGAAIP